MYFDEYVHFSFSKTRKLGPKYDPKSLFLNGYYHDVWYEELDDKTLDNVTCNSIQKTG